MPDTSPLGEIRAYPQEYDPGLLYPIARTVARNQLGLGATLPFHGEDIWNAYEVSWLLPTGVPCVRVATLRFNANSPNIVESKSLKLYLNSLNNSVFQSDAHAADTMATDLAKASGAEVSVDLVPPSLSTGPDTPAWDAWCIDDQTVSVDTYEVDPTLLIPDEEGETVGATVYSNLLRSLCPVTGQPDWASVLIRYNGPWIKHGSLLRYLVSFRNHADYHENCVERIFCDIRERCHTVRLSVYARFTRRGGLDINPFRSDFEATPPNIRLERQ
ncbi:MAG: NADPH-dependent 7-cyano-7-deazaguanine reductase QueF [Pseudomonadota bacterium]